MVLYSIGMTYRVLCGILLIYSGDLAEHRAPGRSGVSMDLSGIRLVLAYVGHMWLGIRLRALGVAVSVTQGRATAMGNYMLAIKMASITIHVTTTIITRSTSILLSFATLPGF